MRSTLYKIIFGKQMYSTLLLSDDRTVLQESEIRIVYSATKIEVPQEAKYKDLYNTLLTRFFNFKTSHKTCKTSLPYDVQYSTT